MAKYDKNKVKAVAKELGFSPHGNFLIGTFSDDVISGFSMDFSPSSSYLWTFILPRFDNISFLHLSLGRRIAELSEEKGLLDEILQQRWVHLSQVKTAEQLLSYIEFGHFEGDYEKWARLLCFVRTGQFDRADNAVNVIGSDLLPVLMENLRSLKEARSLGGWPLVQGLLKEWGLSTDKLMARIA